MMVHVVLLVMIVSTSILTIGALCMLASDKPVFVRPPLRRGTVVFQLVFGLAWIAALIVALRSLP